MLEKKEDAKTLSMLTVKNILQPYILSDKKNTNYKLQIPNLMLKLIANSSKKSFEKSLQSVRFVWVASCSKTDYWFIGR